MNEKRLCVTRQYDNLTDSILDKLDDADMILIGDSLISAMEGECDGFFHAVFGRLLLDGALSDQTDKRKAITNYLESKGFTISRSLP